MRPRISIRGVVRPPAFVTFSVKWSFSDLDSAGRGRKRDEEEGGTRRKDGRGERMDAEKGAMRRVKK